METGFSSPQQLFFGGWTGFGGGDEKGENRSRFGGTLRGGLTVRLPFQKQNRVQKQPAQGSISELDAKGVFCFFHFAWEVSQRPSRFSPFSSQQLLV
jgi:hypothetical protein